MNKMPEDEFQDILEEFWISEVGEKNVEREVFQPDPYWYVDFIVKRPEVIWFIEVENDLNSVRKGVGQGLGYSSDNQFGEPMVIVPYFDTDKTDLQKIRQSQSIISREFDHEAMEFVE